MSERDAKRLDELVKRAGEGGRRDVVMNALSLLSWAISEVENGKEIGSYDVRENHLSTLSMPMLNFFSSDQQTRRQGVSRHSINPDSGT